MHRQQIFQFRWARLLWLACVIGTIFALPFPVFAQASNTQFEVHTVDGQKHVGAISRWSADSTLTIASDPVVSIAGAKLLSLQQEHKLRPRFPRKNVVVFNNGNWLVLGGNSPIRIIKKRLHVQPHLSLLARKTTSIDIDKNNVSIVWLSIPKGVVNAFKEIDRLTRQQRDKDLMIFRNGDSVRCEVLGIDDTKTCQIRLGKRAAQVSFDRIAVIAFANTRAQLRPYKKPHPFVVFDHGSRLSFASWLLTLPKNRFFGESVFGFKLQTLPKNIVAIDIRYGPAVYLSDLRPAKYQHFPYLGSSWPLRKNTNTVGDELRFGGHSFANGLGMHSHSRASYDLNGKYRWFEAWVGLDDEYGKRGRVRLKIEVDGKPTKLGRFENLRWSRSAAFLRVNVHKAQTLTISVEFGEFGDVQGHVNWGNARLIQ